MWLCAWRSSSWPHVAQFNGYVASGQHKQLNVAFQVHNPSTEDQKISVRNLILPPIHSIIVEPSETIIHHHQAKASLQARRGPHHVAWGCLLSCSLCCSGHTTLHALEDVGKPPYSLDPSLWLPCVWFSQKVIKISGFGMVKDTKVTADSGARSSPGKSLWRRFTGWFIRGMPNNIYGFVGIQGLWILFTKINLLCTCTHTQKHIYDLI